MLSKITLTAQNTPFNLYIEPMEISGLGGLQSFAWGQSQGKWLIVGGRLDGLHRRQPFASFDIAGNNNKLIVVDPISKQFWTAPLTSLPTSIQEQLSSTNMEFHQEGKYLYLIGGYGYNASSATKKTFGNLCAIDVPAVIDAIISNTSISAHFRQISDIKMAVTGGHLEKIDNEYYLLGGNKFDGNYNPMGNPTYTQVYTDAVQKFTIQDNDTTITLNYLAKWTDADLFHRRDYNASPQILPNGKEGITVFSGVFQKNVNLPFLSSVSIDSNHYALDSGFQQYYNHYHCAVIPLYSKNKNSMHNVFFGGISQYYDSAGILVQDNNVPFVKTIARVSRSADGRLTEYKLPIEMPSLLGAGSEFITAPDLPVYKNEVIQLDNIMNDTTLIGYIYGGISSNAPNIFFTNTGTQSSASNKIFKVYLLKNNQSKIDLLNKHSNSSLKLQVLPNPTDGEISIKYYLSEPSETIITLYDAEGKLLEKNKIVDSVVGENTFNFKFITNKTGAIYFVSIETSKEKATQKILLKN
jgi:hypothetical protein